MKNCIKCGEKKPAAMFYKHPRMGDGRLNKCIACCKIDANNHRSANLEKIRAYDRKRAKETYRPSSRAAAVRWSKEHQKEVAAQQKLRAAVKKGLVSVLPCDICGVQKVEAHHTDYDKPLVVIWLCRPHHAQTHVFMRELIKESGL